MRLSRLSRRRRSAAGFTVAIRPSRSSVRTRTRGREDPVHEVVLLLETDPLLAEVVDHAVVDRDELVHFGLSGLAEPDPKSFSWRNWAPDLTRSSVSEQRAHECDSHDEGENEEHFDDEQAALVLPVDANRDRREEEVRRGEIEEEPAAQAHASMPYFCIRR